VAANDFVLLRYLDLLIARTDRLLSSRIGRVTSSPTNCRSGPSLGRTPAGETEPPLTRVGVGLSDGDGHREPPRWRRVIAVAGVAFVSVLASGKHWRPQWLTLPKGRRSPRRSRRIEHLDSALLAGTTRPIAMSTNVPRHADSRVVASSIVPSGGSIPPRSGIGLWDNPELDESFPLSEQELRTAISTYGPVVQFHPAEIYNMCSIDWFLQHSKLHDGNTGAEINHPTVRQLPAAPPEDSRYWLMLDDSAKGGDLSTAKAYVHAYWIPGMPYTDIQFWLFYAYNGPGTAHVNGLAFDKIVHSSDVDLAPLGEHYGDWECCVLRIDNTTKRLVGAYLTQHGSRQYFDESQLGQFERGNDQQIVVYSSRNGHALYAEQGPNITEHHRVPKRAWPVGIEFSLRNDTAAGGHWIDCSKNYEIVSAGWTGISTAQWLNYPYRWGPEGTKTDLRADIVANILHAAFGRLSIVMPSRAILRIARPSLPSYRDDLNGPYGPMQKDAWKGQY